MLTDKSIFLQMIRSSQILVDQRQSVGLLIQDTDRESKGWATVRMTEMLTRKDPVKEFINCDVLVQT
jgi:hypothetical protein